MRIESQKESGLEQQVARFKAERRKNRRNALLVIGAVILLGIALLYWQVSITGLHSLETFDSGSFVAGSSADASLSFERIPDFVARVGQEVSFKVTPNQKEVVFRDDTELFDIKEDGRVEFVPDEADVGRHNAWIIIKNNAGSYYYQNVAIIVEE